MMSPMAPLMTLPMMPYKPLFRGPVPLKKGEPSLWREGINIITNMTTLMTSQMTPPHDAPHYITHDLPHDVSHDKPIMTPP